MTFVPRRRNARHSMGLVFAAFAIVMKNNSLRYGSSSRRYGAEKHPHKAVKSCCVYRSGLISMFAYKVIQITASLDSFCERLPSFFTLANLSDLSSLSAEEMSNEIGTQANPAPDTYIT